MSEKAVKVSQELDKLLNLYSKERSEELKEKVEAKRQEMYLAMIGGDE